MAGFGWFWKMLGAEQSTNQKKSRALVSDANEAEADLAKLTDAELVELAKETAADPARRAEFLAVLRIAAEKTLGMRPFDVQVQGCLRLLEGDVVEMATGEGKTLSGAMAAVGYALAGKSVHVVTVNSYLAGRDRDWMGPFVEFFGLTAAAITESMDSEARREAYTCDVVFAPVNELGFDVLRDNLIMNRADAVQHGADVAIVDEADSALVDEALVPLVLAGSAEGVPPAAAITEVVRELTPDIDFEIDPGRRNVFLTDKGARRVERKLRISNLYDDEHVGTTLVQVNLALHAQELLKRDVDYIIRDGSVALVNASRGRVADLQRWPDGLQAAVEAKEGLEVSDGGRILDTMTVQELMGSYPVVCGMTGTAVAAGDQFREFYGLRVSVIDPNEECIRDDYSDRIYATENEKFNAILDYIGDIHRTNRPILVGTQDIAESERIAEGLEQDGIEVVVLNAKNDELEAAIVAEAGAPGRVTVSTQMAGRGTDIRLGGKDESDHEEVVDLGGLCVVGTGRHRTRRLDNQLRGRAGRQGDPGSSVFFVSLDDPMVTEGGAGEELSAVPEEDGRLVEPKVADFVDRAQRVTEASMLQIHSTTWKYNKLIVDQHAIIAKRRAELLDTDAAWTELAAAAPEKAASVAEVVNKQTREQAAREIMLAHLDNAWSDHLAMLDDLRESIHLRAIAKESPIDEFHRQSIAAFKTIATDAVVDAVETFKTARIDEDGVDLAAEDLARPSSTWTYMVNDNPLSGSGSLIGAVEGLFR